MSHCDCVSVNKLHTLLSTTEDIFGLVFGQLCVFALFVSLQQWVSLQAKNGKFPHGYLSYLGLEFSLLCQHKNAGMVLFCIIRSCCYLCLLSVCDGCEAQFNFELALGCYFGSGWL